MKFAFAFLALAGSALAQSITIFAPSANTTVTAGSNLVVDVEKKPGLSGPSDVSVVIGLQTCPSDCETTAASGSIGAPLFKGNYDPQLTPGSGSSAGFQNYTVQIPATMPKGTAMLSVAHFFLGGAALVPGVETVHTTIIVQ
ncbi:hypothetical protein BV20DRAFT_938800 [Pilatotrama ljubarskyi]|nr:hypothetical protein BV20DRAFT_938800 [Pilatotrama ljubarskyi]